MNLFNYYQFFKFYAKLRLLVLVLLNLLIALIDILLSVVLIPTLMALSGVKVGGYTEIFDSIENIGIPMQSTKDQLVVLITVVLVKTSLSWYESFYYTTTIEKILNSIRKDLFEKVSKLPYTEFIRFTSGELSNVCVTEVEKLFFSTRSFIQTIQSAILLLGYFLAVINLNYKISIVFIISAVFIFIIYRKIVKFISNYSLNISDNSARLNQILIQYFTNYKYIKISDITPSYSQFVEKEIKGVEDNRRKIGLLNGIIVAIREPVVVVIILICLLFNFYFIKVESLILVSILFLLYRALNSVNNLQVAWGNFLSSSGSVIKISTFIRELNQLINKEKEFIIADINSDPIAEHSVQIEPTLNCESPIHQGHNITGIHIELSDVNFKLGVKQIISNFSKKIVSGKLYLIKGPSGSGKSTLINLISGLYAPTSGSIKYYRDGSRVTDVSGVKISYVGQEAVMFLDTLWNNITLWDKDIDQIEKQQKFISALRKANLSDLVDKYSFEELKAIGINESGNNWSGGQRQRMNIAREIFKNSEVYIFDESTSALDRENKLGIGKTIKALAEEGKTIFFISHDDQFDSLADEIIVLDVPLVSI